MPWATSLVKVKGVTLQFQEIPKEVVEESPPLQATGMCHPIFHHNYFCHHHNHRHNHRHNHHNEHNLGLKNQVLGLINQDIAQQSWTKSNQLPRSMLWFLITSQPLNRFASLPHSNRLRISEYVWVSVFNLLSASSLFGSFNLRCL